LWRDFVKDLPADRYGRNGAKWTYNQQTMPISFSIVYDLPKSHWGASHMPNKRPANWDAILNSMRSLWIGGTETSLETAFFERFVDAPRFSLPKWRRE
jgi:hypothetical protein